MVDTWQSEEAWIFIGRPQPFVIEGTTRSSDFHRTATIVRDLGDARSLLVRSISITRTAANRADHGIVWITIAWTSIGWPSIVPISSHCSDAWTSPERRISIGRWRTIVEELHDRGSIEPRSGSIRGGIAFDRFVKELREFR